MNLKQISDDGFLKLFIDLDNPTEDNLYNIIDENHKVYGKTCQDSKINLMDNKECILYMEIINTDITINLEKFESELNLKVDNCVLPKSLQIVGTQRTTITLANTKCEGDELLIKSCNLDLEITDCTIYCYYLNKIIGKGEIKIIRSEILSTLNINAERTLISDSKLKRLVFVGRDLQINHINKFALLVEAKKACFDNIKSNFYSVLQIESLRSVYLKNISILTDTALDCSAVICIKNECTKIENYVIDGLTGREHEPITVDINLLNKQETPKILNLQSFSDGNKYNTRELTLHFTKEEISNEVGIDITLFLNDIEKYINTYKEQFGQSILYDEFIQNKVNIIIEAVDKLNLSANHMDFLYYFIKEMLKRGDYTYK